jgi:DNA-binding transcriptional LysR family regulator
MKVISNMLNPVQLSRVDLNLLVLFQTVIEQRHVGRAAERLNLSASAVSHGLKRLRRLLNDPLFMRTPKGVVPTARALELAGPVADILVQVGKVLATAQPFDAASSSRSFTIGAPDGVSAVVLPALLDELAATAPGVDVRIRQLLPVGGEVLIERAWRHVFAELEARAIDVAILPFGPVPVRFRSYALYEEDFVIAMRAGHSFAASPTLDRFCAAGHILVSMTGEAWGFVDRALAADGRSRRIALTVPNFLFALSCVAESDFLAALPRRLVAAHAKRFGLVYCEPPLPLESFTMNAIALQAGLADPGLAWFLDRLISIRPEA